MLVLSRVILLRKIKLMYSEVSWKNPSVRESSCVGRQHSDCVITNNIRRQFWSFLLTGMTKCHTNWGKIWHRAKCQSPLLHATFYPISAGMAYGTKKKQKFYQIKNIDILSLVHLLQNIDLLKELLNNEILS